MSGALTTAPPDTAVPTLEVSGLRKRYRTGKVALDGVSLAARAGELTVVLGPNGCGKSTLVRCVARLTDPTSGEVRIGGVDWSGLRGRRLGAARRQVAVISQGSILIPRRSALANVAMGCLGRHRGPITLAGGFPRDELVLARAALARVGLDDLAEQRADTLSGGQAQRVGIARALVQAPSLLLADEPVASLDPDGTVEVMTLLRQLTRDEGLAVVCVLHQLDTALAFADHVVGMRAAQVVLDLPRTDLEEGALQDLYRDAA